MDRMACVNLPVFPVQLLLQRRPDWQKHPVAVVEADKPQGTILFVNERARSFRIRPGMPYAAGLSLERDLRAAVVPKKDMEDAVSSLGKRLRSFSPHVEPAREDPGLFWIDASGLERLYGSAGRWARRIESAMDRAGFRATVVVGFSRFGTYALAKAGQGIMIFKDPVDEQTAAQRVSLDRLALAPTTRDILERLGIKTVGQFIALPSDGIAKRFGREAFGLHRLASGQLRLPFQPERPLPPPMLRQILDHPETDIGRLMKVIERLLHSLLRIPAGQAHALTEVEIWFRFERMGDHMERIRPAAPTLDARQLLNLIRLRLQAVPQLPDGVVEVVLKGRDAPAIPENRRLLDPRPKRDLAAGNRALARVRAELGDGAVVRARLRKGHLPEGRFTWEPLDALALPKPRNGDAGRLIRRIVDRAIPLRPDPKGAADTWMVIDSLQDPVVRMLGPYMVSGGWWRRLVRRDYYFVETRGGELLWVYHDRARRRWFLQGRVE